MDGSSRSLSVVPEAVIEYFDLGAIRSIEQLRSDSTSAALKLVSESGRWFLKRHRPGKTFKQLQLEIAIQLRLKATGFLYIASFKPGLDGEYCLSHDGTFWSVQDLVDAYSAFDWTDPLGAGGWSREHCFRAGAALAQLHWFGQFCLALQENWDLAGSISGSVLGSIPGWFDSALVRAEPVAAGNPSSESVLLHIARSKAPLAALLGETLAEIEGWNADHQNPVLLVHGDYHPGNTLFTGSDLRAIIDFDYAHLESAVYDLGYAAIMFCTRAGGSLTDLQNEDPLLAADLESQIFNQEFFTALIAGYRQSLSRIARGSLGEKISRAVESDLLLNAYARIACYLILLWALDEHRLGTGGQLADAARVTVRALNTLQWLSTSRC